MAEHWAAEDEEEKVKSEALKIINLFQNLPRLVVFDLDYTLWPFFWYRKWVQHAFGWTGPRGVNLEAPRQGLTHFSQKSHFSTARS